MNSKTKTMLGTAFCCIHVSRIAVYGFVTPVAGVILSMIILGEASIVGWIYFPALLLVSISIIVVNH